MTPPQIKKVVELLKQGWITVMEAHPPPGGPTLMRTPEGRYYHIDGAGRVEETTAPTD